MDERIKGILLDALATARNVVTEHYIEWSRHYQCWECMICGQRQKDDAEIKHLPTCYVGKELQDLEDARIYLGGLCSI